MLQSYVHTPALPFFSPRKIKLVTLEGSQSPGTPFFVTLQTSEESAGSEEWVRWSVLWKTVVMLFFVSCIIKIFFPITQLKIFFLLPGQMAFPHNPKYTQSLQVMKKLLCLYNCDNVEALDDLK